MIVRSMGRMRGAIPIVGLGLLQWVDAQNPGNGAFGDTTDTAFGAGPTGTSSSTPSLQDVANSDSTSHSHVIILVVLLAVAFIFVLLGAIAYNIKFMRGKLGGRDMFNRDEDPTTLDDGGLAQNTRRNAGTVGGVGSSRKRQGAGGSDGLWSKVASPFTGGSAKGRRTNRDREAWKGLHGEDAEEMWDDRMDDSEVHRLGTMTGGRSSGGRLQGPFGDIPIDHDTTQYLGGSYEDPFSVDTGAGQYMPGGGRAAESTISLHAPGIAQAAPPAYDGGDSAIETSDSKSDHAYEYVHERD